MKQILLSLFATVLLSACGSTGTLNLTKLQDPIPDNKARIVVTRDTSFLYLAASADVIANGTKIASLGRGGSVVYDIPKGNNVLTVCTFGSFGRYTINFEAKSHKTYEFTVSPRGSAMWTASAFGMAGDAINASVSEQAGYFQITPKGGE